MNGKKTLFKPQSIIIAFKFERTRLGRKNTKKSEKFNIPLLLLLPSLLALAISITALLYAIGNRLFDLNNPLYRVFLSAHDAKGVRMNEEDALRKINEILLKEKVPGFLVLKNAQNGEIFHGNELYIRASYQILLLDIPRKKAYKVANELREGLHQNMAHIEESVALTNFVTKDGVFENYADALKGKND